MAQAVELLKQPRRRGRAAAPAPLKEVGNHPETGKPIKLMSGRYGPYVTDGEINASLPKTQTPEELDVEGAVELLRRRAERIAAGGGGRRKKKATKKKAAKKKTTKKKAAKKKASKKKAAARRRARSAKESGPRPERDEARAVARTRPSLVVELDRSSSRPWS